MGSVQGDIVGSRSFLQAKLSPPGLPIGHLPRAGLLDSLRRGDGVHLAAVTAPAGYGKTTLLAEWAASDDRGIGWVSLDDGDNDPVELVFGLAAAFGPTQDLPSSFWESMAGPGSSALGRLGPRLAAALASARAPFVLMIDDVHKLTSPTCHDVIDLLMGAVPAGSALVTAGRVEPPNLPSWRVRTSVVEVGAEQLAFGTDEARHFFRLGGAKIPEQSVLELHEKLEGWVAGLQLALIVSRRSSIDVSLRDRYVADYLRREVLEGLSEEHRSFLVQTAVLDELSGNLCDALLGRDDSTARLDELERANLFVRALGGERVWYRCHSAFREVLLEELERSGGAAERQRRHGIASTWYEEQGMPEEAVEHALLAGDADRSARLVARVAQGVYIRGRLATVLRWLDELGDAAILGYPPLAVLAGWCAALSGEARDAERWGAVVERLRFDNDPGDGSASFASARAMYLSLLCRNGPDQMLADAERAAAAEPAWSPWRTTAEGLTAEACLLRGGPGDLDAALAWFDDAIESAQQGGITDSHVVWLAERALIAMERSDWARAREDTSLALRLVEEGHLQDYFVSALAFAAAARVALHDGDRAEAERHSAQAMRSRVVTTYAVPFFAVRVRLVLARLRLAMGEPVVATHLLHEIDGLLRRRPQLGSLIGEIEGLRELVASAPLRGGASPLSAAELRVLPYLQTHLKFEEVAGRLHITRNTVASHARSIYRKLGAESRGEAVERAIALRLLGDFAGTAAP